CKSKRISSKCNARSPRHCAPRKWRGFSDISIVTVSDSPARGGGWVSERKGPLLELVNRRYKRTIYVETDDLDDGPETVLGATGVPQIGDSYKFGNDADDIAVCIDVQAEPLGDYPFLWKVTASYDSSRVVDQ